MRLVILPWSSVIADRASQRPWNHTLSRGQWTDGILALFKRESLDEDPSGRKYIVGRKYIYLNIYIYTYIHMTIHILYLKSLGQRKSWGPYLKRLTVKTVQP